MSDITTLQKYRFIIEEFNRRPDKTLNAYDECLQDKLNLKPKQLGRLLDEFANVYDNIVVQKEKNKKIYKLIKPADIFMQAFENASEIGWLFAMAQEGNPEVFKQLAEYTSPQKHLYLFKNSPFEDLSTLEAKETFKRLKTAIRFREYRRIKFMHDDNVYDNLLCLKLIFMDNNWYMAFLDEGQKVRFGRISFIESVEYASKMGSYSLAGIQKYLDFLQKAQNSLTLYGAPVKTAFIKALPPVARYFEEGMKPFLASQKFVKYLEDGSVIFTLSYTQELEIFPMIQRWMPDLIILEPQELKEAYAQKLSSAITNLDIS